MSQATLRLQGENGFMRKKYESMFKEVNDQKEETRCLARCTYLSCESYRSSRQLLSIFPSKISRRSEPTSAILTVQGLTLKGFHIGEVSCHMGRSSWGGLPY